MTPDCDNDCTEPQRFPKEILNRPGLSRINYRIGTYSDFRAAMLRQLNQNLPALTHRQADDNAIALLEGASILGDILTFYQDIYANEAFLRTAQWRESVADLVRLTGYRLSPGLGGRAIFTFGVKGDNAVVVPKGFAIKAQVTGLDKPADFETTAATVAYPYLSQFNLYIPRKVKQAIQAGKNTLEVQSVAGKKDVTSIQAIGLKAGDRIILIPDNPLQQAEIIIISKVKQVLDRIILEFEGSLTNNWGTEVKAYRLGRSFKHFGHNAPPIITGLDNSDPPKATQTNTNYLRRIYQDHIPTPNNTKYYSQLAKTIFPLDIKVDDLAAGNKLICQGFLAGYFWRWEDWTLPPQLWLEGLTAVLEEMTDLIEGITNLTEIETENISEIPSTFVERASDVSPVTRFVNMPTQLYKPALFTAGQIVVDPGLSSSLVKFDRELIREIWQLLGLQRTPFTVVKEIKSVTADAFKWGNISGSATSVTLDSRLIAEDDVAQQWQFCDIRQLQFYEVKSAEIQLRAPTEWETNLTNSSLNYWGTYQEVQTLIGRNLILQKGAEIIKPVTVTNTSFPLEDKDEKNPWLWLMTLSDNLKSFLPEDFNEENPQVQVYGNLVEATQGKTEKEAILGNGDRRLEFQTFKLLKSPLTYLNSVGETPPEVPELQIYVNDRLWKRVSSFFNYNPKDEIYIVREDVNGDSWVQFGDGKTGARLPSGIKNVVAKYRTGVGAHGTLQAGTNVQAAGKLERLDKIWLPGVVSGGTQPETADNAKQAAPGKTQSLGRLVSLEDFASETLAISGVTKVSAAWKLVNNIPSVVLIVLMETGREKEIQEVQRILNDYNRSRGAFSSRIKVIPGSLQYVYLDVKVAIDPTYREEVVKKAIKQALGVTGEEANGVDGSQGLFGLQKRQFAQHEYETRIEGIIQNVAGVVWTEVQILTSLGSAEDPSKLTISSNTTPPNNVICDADKILTLYTAHLNFSISLTQ
jgi:hypothetical protein